MRSHNDPDINCVTTKYYIENWNIVKPLNQVSEITAHTLRACHLLYCLVSTTDGFNYTHIYATGRTWRVYLELNEDNLHGMQINLFTSGLWYLCLQFVHM